MVHIECTRGVAGAFDAAVVHLSAHQAACIRIFWGVYTYILEASRPPPRTASNASPPHVFHHRQVLEAHTLVYACRRVRRGGGPPLGPLLVPARPPLRRHRPQVTLIPTLRSWCPSIYVYTPQNIRTHAVYTPQNISTQLDVPLLVPAHPPLRLRPQVPPIARTRCPPSSVCTYIRI